MSDDFDPEYEGDGICDLNSRLDDLVSLHAGAGCPR